MNRRFVRAFAAVCIVAAIGAVGFVVYRVLSEDAAGALAAKADFEGLRSVLAYVKSPSDLADPGLRARLASRYEANPSLLLIDVYERGAGDRWRIPADSPYLPSVRSEGAVPQPAYPPSTTLLLSSPLKADTSGRLAVDALYTSLTQLSAFEAFRDTLIALAAFLAMAALVLAIVSGSDAARGPSAEAAGLAPEGATRNAAQSAARRAATAADLASAAAEYQYETLHPSAADEADDQAAVEKAASGLATGISIKTAVSPLDEDFDIPIVSDAPRLEGSSSQTGEQETGLYSPASGLGWESYLKDRLDAELARSASFEQDLSLLAISYDGLTNQDADYSAIGETIRKFFSFRDLSFERGDDGFSVILPNIDSSHALRMAQEFYKKLVFLAQGDYAELELMPLYLGISSRGGRLVDALRLIEEADAALDKARFERDTRIVAFKPDPDKYRIYLASKGA